MPQTNCPVDAAYWLKDSANPTDVSDFVDAAQKLHLTVGGDMSEMDLMSERKILRIIHERGLVAIDTSA